MEGGTVGQDFKNFLKTNFAYDWNAAFSANGYDVNATWENLLDHMSSSSTVSYARIVNGVTQETVNEFDKAKASGDLELVASLLIGGTGSGRVNQGSSKAIEVPGRVQSRINLRNGSSSEGAGWEHVVDRHFNPTKNASQFTVTQEELRGILQSESVINTPVTRTLESADGIRYVREINLDKTIGIDKFSGQPTSIMTVLTDKFGNLVTATPGVIK